MWVSRGGGVQMHRGVSPPPPTSKLESAHVSSRHNHHTRPRCPYIILNPKVWAQNLEREAWVVGCRLSYAHMRSFSQHQLPQAVGQIPRS